MTDHTPTPWHYRPHKYDDWGWIRATPEPGETIGVTVAMAKSGKYEDEDALNEHRRNKTDPYGANAKYIVDAVNSHEPLKAALDLALAYMSKFEPGDSRAVSDEFVAMAAVAAGDFSEPVMLVIRNATLALLGKEGGTND